MFSVDNKVYSKRKCPEWPMKNSHTLQYKVFKVKLKHLKSRHVNIKVLNYIPVSYKRNNAFLPILEPMNQSSFVHFLPWELTCLMYQNSSILHGYLN